MKKERLGHIKILIITLFSVLLIQCGHKDIAIKIKLTNNIDLPRQNETITLNLNDLFNDKNAVDLSRYIVRDLKTDSVLVSQLVDLDEDGKDDQLLFQSHFAPYQIKYYSIEPGPEKVRKYPSKVYARFVPTRKDDFAWENDRIAFRMYGPALQADGEISSGVDVWVKSVPDLILDKWYQPGFNYHEDHGEGLDFYKVGPSRGCGGTGFFVNDAMINSNNFITWKIIANGPIRSIFQLSYAPVKIGEVEITEVKTVSLDAGQNLNRFENRYKADVDIRNIPLAIGIVKRKGNTMAQYSKESGWMSYWEPEHKKDGSIGCGIVLNPSSISKILDITDHSLILTKMNRDNSIVYYAGACWSKGGTFENKEQWQEYLQNFASSLKSKISIEIIEAN